MTDIQRLAYTRTKTRRTWKRSPDLDNLDIICWMAAKLSAKIHNTEVKWRIVR